ncbi:hypothetical protein HDV05_007656 [Chytridiales sp. JEL 0842]|nr:hypothetical protein HDV05_007656 [Chytridiales sp. JEL 0842]
MNTLILLRLLWICVVAPWTTFAYSIRITTSNNINNINKGVAADDNVNANTLLHLTFPPTPSKSLLDDDIPPTPGNSSTSRLRSILSTGNPPSTSAFGTVIWAGQSASIRFTAPPDVPVPGAELIQIQFTLRSSQYVGSNCRLSVVEDSGRNSPGTRVLDSRSIRVPVYNGRIVATAEYRNFYIYPGEIFWIVMEGDARGGAQEGFSWLDSVDGVAWTGFQTFLVPDTNETESGQEGSGWTVERLRGASSVSVTVR